MERHENPILVYDNTSREFLEMACSEGLVNFEDAWRGSRTSECEGYFLGVDVRSL